MHTVTRATGLVLAVAGLTTSLTRSYLAGLSLSLTAAGCMALVDRTKRRRP